MAQITDLTAETSIADGDYIPFRKTAATRDRRILWSNLKIALGLGTMAAATESNYLLLAGRSGGQVAIGGTGSGDTLTLQSTSHATKGKILFGNSTYDEANNRLGIGTAVPTEKLYVYDPSANSVVLVQTSGTDANVYAGIDLYSDVVVLNMRAFTGASAGGARLNFLVTGGYLLFGTTEDDPIAIYTNATERVTVAADGKVGIGTVTPSSLLDVAGTVQADGLRLDVTPTSETIVCTHTITISINGTNYKVPCRAA